MNYAEQRNFIKGLVNVQVDESYMLGKTPGEFSNTGDPQEIFRISITSNEAYEQVLNVDSSLNTFEYFLRPAQAYCQDKSPLPLPLKMKMSLIEVIIEEMKYDIEENDIHRGFTEADVKELLAILSDYRYVEYVLKDDWQEVVDPKAIAEKIEFLFEENEWDAYLTFSEMNIVRRIDDEIHFGMLFHTENSAIFNEIEKEVVSILDLEKEMIHITSIF